MKRLLFTLTISILAIFNLSCDAESLKVLIDEAKAILGTPGCMQQGNASFDNLATVHVDSLCAALSYGCTDANALNYNEPCMTLNNMPCTDMCPEIAADLCCTQAKLGCTDRAANNFDITANSNAAAGTTGACTYNEGGCMIPTACNYSTMFSKDCAGGTLGTTVADTTGGIDCCNMPSTTGTTCYLDIDNNGFAETSKDVAAGSCGCYEEGIGWTNTVNGNDVLGCTDPTCIEFNPAATVNNGMCCLTELLDASGVVDSSYLQGVEFTLLGEYEMTFSSGCPGGNLPEGDEEHGYLWLGWGGTFYHEFERTHKVIGFPVEPKWNSADSYHDCETAAGGAPFFCANVMQNFENFQPCPEIFYQHECWNNPECSWEFPQCQKVEDTTCSETSETLCEAENGCWWEDGIDEYTGQQFGQPHCYFDCWDLEEGACNSLNTKCDWKTENPGEAGGGGFDPSYCKAATASTPGECGTISDILGFASNGNAHCYWEPDDPNNFSGSGICECQMPNISESVCEAAYTGLEWITPTTQPAYAECVPMDNSSCSNYYTFDNCQAQSNSQGCEWNFGQNICSRYEGFVDQTAGCSQNNDKTTCETNGCEWWAPHRPADCAEGNTVDCTPAWADDGACNFFDPCHYINNEYFHSGYSTPYECENSWDDCYWSDGQGDEEPGCWKNQYEQYCDCRVDWTQTSCVAAGYTWQQFDNFGGQCLQPMDQYSCYGGDFGSQEGFIDCDQYLPAGIDRFQEWDSSTNTCLEIKTESIEGSWSIDGNQLCHEKVDLETDCSTITTFEPCECSPNCMWQGQGNAQDNPYQWETNGACQEFAPGSGRVSVSENPRINGTNKMFYDTKLLEMLYSLSSSPPPDVCSPYELLSNGNIQLTEPNGCVVTLMLKSGM